MIAYNILYKRIKWIVRRTVRYTTNGLGGYDIVLYLSAPEKGEDLTSAQHRPVVFICGPRMARSPLRVTLRSPMGA